MHQHSPLDQLSDRPSQPESCQSELSTNSLEKQQPPLMRLTNTLDRPQKFAFKSVLKCFSLSFPVFRILEHLVSHMVTHRSYRCNYCSKEYRIKTHLARHVQQAHSANGSRSDSPRQIMKTRPAFLVRPHQLERAARVTILVVHTVLWSCSRMRP